MARVPVDRARSHSPKLALALLPPTAAGLLFRDALFRGHTFFERDLYSYYRGAKALVAPLTSAAGGLPTWNPYFASGQPFAANPEHALFHPLTWLFLLLPFEWAFRLQVMLPVLAAAASMSFLLRSLRRSRFAAAFGGLVWAFGGYTLSVTNLLPTLLATSVLPAVLGFTLRAARQGRARDLAGLALTFGVEALAGDPVTLLMTPLLVVTCVVQVGVERRRRPPGLFWLGGPLLGLLLGGCLAGASLLPGLRLASRTVRAQGLGPEQADVWSMPPQRVLELLAPRALGHLGTQDPGYWGLPLYPTRTTPFIYSLYPGLLATSLAAAVVLLAVSNPRRRRSRTAFVWSGVGLLGGLLALGSHFPLWGVVKALPLFSGTRYPEKFVLISCLALTVLAADGFHRLLLRGRGTARLVGGLLALGAVVGEPLSWALGRASQLAVSAPAIMRDALLMLITAAVLGLALVAFRRCPRSAGPWLLLLVSAGDLLHHGRALVRTRPEQTLSAPPALAREILRAAPTGPVFHAAGWLQAREADFAFLRPPLPAFWGIATTFEPDFDLTELTWSAQATEAFLEVLRAQPQTGFAVLRRRGGEIVIRLRAGTRVADGLVEAPQSSDGPLELRFVTPAKPFAFCAEKVRRVTGVAGWKEAALRLGTEAWDTVVVDASVTGVPTSPAGGEVRIVERRPNRIVIDVVGRGPESSLLAINQTWDEFWTARIDEVESPLLRADISLQALPIPAGARRVVLTYRDPWIPAGLALSGAALVATLGLGLRRSRGVAGS